jgi:Fe2+ transport system protein FeoA
LEKQKSMSESVNITSLQEGDQGVIHAIEGGSAITSRFAGMGIVSNARFRIAQISGGLIVLQVAIPVSRWDGVKLQKSQFPRSLGGRCMYAAHRKGNFPWRLSANPMSASQPYSIF